jgi:hypothetical protein
LELATASPTSEIGAGDPILRRVPPYIDFLLTTDGLDAETAVLGAEFGAGFFAMFGHAGGAGAHYGRMLDCLSFIIQWGSPEQKRSAVGQIAEYANRWGARLPISVLTWPSAMALLEDLRANRYI